MNATVWTVEDFLSENRGLSAKQISTQQPATTGGLMAGGPTRRYILDPQNPSSGVVIDLRHLIIIGSYSETFGNAVEKIQTFFNDPSGGDIQDYFSNSLGREFYKQYGKLIDKQPTWFAEYLTQYLTTRQNTHYIYQWKR